MSLCALDRIVVTMTTMTHCVRRLYAPVVGGYWKGPGAHRRRCRDCERLALRLSGWCEVELISLTAYQGPRIPSFFGLAFKATKTVGVQWKVWEFYCAFQTFPNFSIWDSVGEDYCSASHICVVSTSCPSPLSGVRSLWMFVRKPNPTLTLIQGQRNSCNLSLYLLGSLFPFSLFLSLSHILSVSSVDSCLSHQCSLFAPC